MLTDFLYSFNQTLWLGVMEKLGLGPEALLKKNPRLIYARLTGELEERKNIQNNLTF